MWMEDWMYEGVLNFEGAVNAGVREDDGVCLVLTCDGVR